MKAGRWLDNVIAIDVLGWRQEGTGDGTSDYLVDTNGRRYSVMEGSYNVPRFSLDITAAWDVWERLCWIKGERWPKTDLSLSFHSDYGIDHLRGWCVDLGANKIVKFADTAPHAICLAAIELTSSS